MLKWILNAKQMIGLDRSTLYTVLARLFAIVGSTGTVLLIARFLNSVEQGYYYTLLSLITLQVIFELGFSFVILQLAAHESANVTLSEVGVTSGPELNRDRLASILQLTVRWYTRASIAMAAILFPFGMAFFARQSRAGDGVSWQWPWALAVLFTCASLFLTPLFSFLEGCGQVRQVAAMRMRQSLAAAVAAWAMLLAGKGLYSPAMVVLGQTIVGVAFLWGRRRLLSHLMRHRVADDVFSWRNEVWPFQWKIAVSWLCTYFTVQIFTPVLFLVRGPVEAGRLGMSINIAGYMWNIVYPWISTKAAPFGQMISRGELDQLDVLFKRTLRQSLVIMTGIVCLCMSGIIAIQYVYPKLAYRMVSPWNFSLLLITALCTLVVQSQAVYLRAFKSEPFLTQSLAVAIMTCLVIAILVPRMGDTGAVITYFSCSGVLGVAAATYIFTQRRREALNAKAVLTLLGRGQLTEQFGEDL